MLFFSDFLWVIDFWISPSDLERKIVLDWKIVWKIYNSQERISIENKEEKLIRSV